VSGKKNHITVFEHEKIHVGNKYGCTLFTERHRQCLESFYGMGVPYFDLIHKGIKFKEFVGVLQLDGFCVEVLPKADKYEKEEDWREILINMLKSVGAFDVYAPSTSMLNIKTNFILDLYFEIFIHEVNYLFHQGLTKRYRNTEGNVLALKGALNFGKHVTKNFIHHERFYVNYSVYDYEHLINQILYKTILLIQKQNSNPVLSDKISSLLLSFPQLDDVKVSEQTFEKIKYSRKTEKYRKAIEISKLLLLNYHPDVSRGKNNVLALMFDMNLLWERFIYKALRRNANENITVQAQANKPFWKPQGGFARTIKPDIVLEFKDNGNSKRIVLDTKWKNIKDLRPSIEDLRQMYVYHEFFNAEDVALVYPGDGSFESGKYYSTVIENIELSNKKCSIITIPVEKNISSWQKKIADMAQGFIEKPKQNYKEKN